MRAGKPSQCTTMQPLTLTQPGHPSGLVNQVPACLAGVKAGHGWYMCDLIWQMTLRSSEMGSVTHLTYFCCSSTPRTWTGR